MTRFQRLRRAAALVGAALLVAAFVLYRAGFGTGSMSATKSTFIFVGSDVKPPAAKQPPNAAPAPGGQPEAATRPGELPAKPVE